MRPLPAAACAALLAMAGAASAQGYPAVPPPAVAAPHPAALLPPWMQDDGASLNHPISMPSDVAATSLDAPSRNGVAPPVEPAPYPGAR